MSNQSQKAAAWLERLSISNLIIALPVIHLLVASLYTWAWLAGFGANVSVLADPRDLFSVSISKLVTVYLIGLVLPTAQSIFMHKRFKGDSNIKGALSSTSYRFKAADYAVMSCVWFVISFSIFGIYDLQHRGYSQGLQMLIVSSLVGIVCYKFVIDHIELDGGSYRAINVGVGLLFSAIGFGLSDGNTARYSGYEAYHPRLVRCGENLVLRRFGDYYIAIARDDSKVVVDLECKIVMSIPKVRGKARREFHWNPYPHIHYVSVDRKPVLPHTKGR